MYCKEHRLLRSKHKSPVVLHLSFRTYKMKSSIQIYEIQSGIYPLKVELYEIALVDPGGGHISGKKM